MAAFLSPTPTLRFYGTNGHPLAGGFLITYDSTTSQPIATWSDVDMTTKNPVQIPLDANGEPSVNGIPACIFLEEGKRYKYRWFDNSGVQIGEVDPVQVSSNSGGGGGVSEDAISFQYFDVYDDSDEIVIRRAVM